MRNLLFGLLIAGVISQAIITPKYYGEEGGIPIGSIILTTTSCSTGYAEVSELNGKFLLGTLVANGNVGTTGGADNITPTGTNGTGTVTPLGGVNTPTLSWPASVPTAANESAHTHTYTQVPNHVHPDTAVTLSQGSTTASTTGTHGMTSTATGGSQRQLAANDAITITAVNPTGGVATGTTAAGSAHTHVLSWPASVPTSAALTFTGSSSVTSAQTWTGTQFDNRPSFTRVIFCVKQ